MHTHIHIYKAAGEVCGRARVRGPAHDPLVRGGARGQGHSISYDMIYHDMIYYTLTYIMCVQTHVYTYIYIYISIMIKLLLNNY